MLQEAFARDTTFLGAASMLRVAVGNANRWQQRDSLHAFLQARKTRLSRGDALYLAVVAIGSPEEQYRAVVELYEADPSDLTTYLALAISQNARRPEEALRFYARRDTSTVWGRRLQAWDVQAGLAYHALGRFEEELALARAAKAREPRAIGHWFTEVGALAALGRREEIDRLITESFGLEDPRAPIRLAFEAFLEFASHGPDEVARAYAVRSLAGVNQWPDSLQTIMASNIRRGALRGLGDHEAVWRIYDDESRADGPVGLGNRLLGARDRILMGDTTGALALVDSARSQPLTAFAGSAWGTLGAPRYRAAHILALLGRRDEAVALLREALNNGWRLAVDEELQWYWAPIKDYPPFQELVRLRDGS